MRKSLYVPQNATLFESFLHNSQHLTVCHTKIFTFTAGWCDNTSAMTAPNRSNKFKKNSIAQILVVGVYKWPQKIPLSLVSAYFSLFCGPYLTFVVLIPLLPFLEESYVDCRFAVLSFLAPSTTASQEQLSQSTQSVGEPDKILNFTIYERFLIKINQRHDCGEKQSRAGGLERG